MTTNTGKRKLTTILAADVISYSKMMADDEEATLDTLKAYRIVTDELIDKHNGRIFSTAGDAFLAEFDSAVEAVRCSISIQEDLRVRNSQLPEERQMWFRIGVNVGDVIIEKGDLFGDGVNVAARLEGLAEKGGICISGSTFDQVKNKLSIAFDDIGAQKVKNIPEPIPAFRLVPGLISVKDADRSPDSGRLTILFPQRTLTLLISGFIFAILILIGTYFTGLLPFSPISNKSYDGRWKVTLNSLAGCRDNNPRSFFINVLNGKINEQRHPLPKTGTISADGQIVIKVTDTAGNLRATQTGKIVGNIGEGQLQGKKPGCTGNIVLERIN